ncbi:MAG: hypothetical protein ACKOZW_09610 [Cyanobium sp.]
MRTQEGALFRRRLKTIAGQANRWDSTNCQDAVSAPETEKGSCKVRANVPINRPQRDLYCANQTSGPRVSGITATVQITVTACIFSDPMNSNPNLAALTDRNF